MISLDRKSTRRNSSHLVISYAVFCLKKKQNKPSPVVDDPTALVQYTVRRLAYVAAQSVVKNNTMARSTMTAAAARVLFFFFNDTATTEIYTLSLHDALPISRTRRRSVTGPVSTIQHLQEGC